MMFAYALLLLLQLVFLFPLKDRRERQRGFPWATAALVALNVVIHLIVTLVLILQPAQDFETVQFNALYPYMLVPQHILDARGLGALSVLTSGFLHANLAHLMGNMFFLWFFGRKVEDSTGPERFLLFYLFCLFGSALVSTLVEASLSNFNAQIPSLGASGAIAGVMAAYLFLYSEERVFTLFAINIPGLCIIPTPLPMWLPSWVFIVYTLLGDAAVGQILQEVSALVDGPVSTGVGVFAHLGGAATGFIFLFFFMHPEVFARHR